jgi:chemotaxis signal transduction protein
MTKTDSETRAQETLVDPVEALSRPFVLPEEALATTQIVAQDSVVDTQVSLQNSTQARMNFRVGDIELLCPDDASREVVDSPSVNRLPNTASWFKGLANVRGGMTPVVDFGQALGNQQTSKKCPYMMIFGRGDDAVGLLIDEIPKNISIGTKSRLSSLPSIVDILDGCVLGAYDINNRIHFDLDVDKLFKILNAKIRLA